jgi:hypothetical protein
VILRVISHNRLEEEHHDDRDSGDRPPLFLHEHLAQPSPDLKRESESSFINAPLSAQADNVCGAEYDARSVERANRPNGSRAPDPGHPGRQA